MDFQDVNQFKNVRALLMGDFMVDKYILGNVNRISPEAPVPVLEVVSKEARLGGAGNVVNNIISLGAQVRILGCVGSDADGAWIKNSLRQSGADVSFLYEGEKVQTIVKTRVAANNQQFLRYDEETIRDAPAEYIGRIKENAERILDGVNVIVFSDYGKGMVVPELSQFLIRHAKERNIPVVIDPKGRDYSKYRGATVCTPNSKELREASGKAVGTEEELTRAGQALREAIDLDDLIVTRSEKGISLFERGREAKEDFPARAKEVVDVTGAGDTVIAVLSLGLAVGLPIQECCILANHAASIVISKFGTATTTAEEMIGRSRDLDGKKLVGIEEIRSISAELRARGKKVVFTNGCFDLLHAGHLSSLTQARSFGDVLVVGLNSDASVKVIKGESRPIIGQKDRAALLSSLSMVDYVVIFDEPDPQKLIEAVLPDVLVKGEDWKGKGIIGSDVVEKHSGRVEFLHLEAGLSTTNIIRKIRSVYTGDAASEKER